MVLANKWLKTDSHVTFATLQGKTADTLRKTTQEFPPNLDAIVLHDSANERTYVAAKAFFVLARQFRWPWRGIALFDLLPSVLSNVVYDIVARNRYKLFGRKVACEIPSVEFRNRFIVEDEPHETD